MGLWGEKVDAIEYYKQQIKELDKKVSIYFSLVIIMYSFSHFGNVIFEHLCTFLLQIYSTSLGKIFFYLI